MRRLAGNPKRLFPLCLALAALWLIPTAAMAGPDPNGDPDVRGRFCSETANAIYRACGNEVLDDYWIAVAFCLNVSDDDERSGCRADARDDLREGRQLCTDQRTGRRGACRLLGEGRYDPDFDPGSFDDDFTALTNPNPYFPLGIGNRWQYRGGSEAVSLEILNATKLIDGVRCIVLRDLVTKDGDLVEATDDWFAQALNGDVWYCGEEVKDFESFDGDRPRVPELVSTDGSFKAGRDGEKPGIIFLASPRKGRTYLEEFSLGNAEDVTTILATDYRFGSDSDLDRHVPGALAQMLCAGDCVVTRNFSLLEPGVSARKYYAPGIGVFLEVESSGEVIQLVGCNFDPRCAALPQP